MSGGLLLCREFEESLFHNCNETEQRKRLKKANRVENIINKNQTTHHLEWNCLQADGKGREKNGIRGVGDLAQW